MISTLENINGNNKIFILKYPKYKITFSNFRIISPILDNISMNEKDINSPSFTFDNITFGFFFDILLSFNYERNIYKKDCYLNTTISSIKFKYNKNDEYLSFESFGDINSYLDYNLINTNFDIDMLDFFKEFYEKKKCLCIDISEHQCQNPNIFIYNQLQAYIKDYISKFESLNILITYDAYRIFNATLKIINCSNELIKYVKINKIIIPSEKIHPQDHLISKIWIKQMEFIGVYYSLINNKEIYFYSKFEYDDEKNFVTLLNGKITFSVEQLTINCDNCKQEEKNALEEIIKNDYKTLLLKENQNYYKDNN